MIGKKLLLVLIVLMYSVGMLGGKNVRTESLLDSLDKVLEQRQAMLGKKQSVINDLKRGICEVSTPEALTIKYEQIFTEYLHFNGDSAIEYARRAVKTAISTDRPELILSARLCLLRAYTRQGLMGKGYEVISRIGGIEDMDPAFRGQYADMLLDFYMRMTFKSDINYMPSIDAKEAWKRYSSYLSKDTWEYYFYKSTCTRRCDTKQMELMLSQIPQPSHQAANLYVTLAIEYKMRGDTDRFYKNLILSAINDVLLANTEVSSMLYLLQTPLLEKDLGRSYAYVQVCADNVNRYHDMQRALKVVEVQERINKQFDELHRRQVTIVVIIAILFFIALVISVIEGRLVASRGQKVKRALEALKISHRKQAELTAEQKHFCKQLQEANGRLSNRAHTYRKDFLNVYHLVSTYISYEKEIRKDVLNLLKTGNVRKAIRIISSNAEIDEQLKLFYHHFDHAFLSMNPDFIHRLNTLVKPENRFDESQKELTTPLRIYALMLLGITDSVGIADFLHLSSQTVYNYRLKMRRLSVVGEKEFDDSVINRYIYNNDEDAPS